MPACSRWSRRGRSRTARFHSRPGGAVATGAVPPLQRRHRPRGLGVVLPLLGQGGGAGADARPAAGGCLAPGAAGRQHEDQRDERAEACGGAWAVGHGEAHNETEANPLTALY